MVKSKKEFSNVEKIWLERSGRKLSYSPRERIGVIEVENFPSLGKLTALRFLEWVQDNPEGVIALPTGKTPEHFIKWVHTYLANWEQPDLQKNMQENGLDISRKPDLRGLQFVQIDEFYPIDPRQSNSFFHYVNRFYMQGFGLDPKRALFIDTSKIALGKGEKLTDIFPDNIVDLTLRTRHPESRLETRQKDFILRVDEWCHQYEMKIREKGGIGFFLGGIGPDGHIGFNVMGSDHYSTTRLTPTNYETQAAAASDLGGIEVARNRLVITIGLATICYRPNVVAIIIAAGEAKAPMVYNAIQQEPSNRYPATALQKLPNARFYLTKGAARLLTERAYLDIKDAPELDDTMVERVVIDLALARNKRILNLTRDDFAFIRSSQLVLKRYQGSLESLKAFVDQRLRKKIERGRQPVKDKTYMHMGPHHDDIMLGYLPHIVHLVRPASNRHSFSYATSGFNAVTNSYVRVQLEKAKHWLKTDEFQRMIEEGYFDTDNEIGRQRDVLQYLDGIAAHSRTMKEEGDARRLVRNLIFLFEENSTSQLINRIDELVNYFQTQYPGKKDLPHIQRLKGMIREWEADLLWGYFGFHTNSVHHIRMGFYKGEIFTELPKIDRDVMPIYRLMQLENPDVVSVALDPEASGPDTHYKVLQATAEALKMYQRQNKDVKVLGYRNVWYRFHPAEANMYVPVSLNSMAIMENAFMNCFGSQREASFPSYEYDGPFCRLAQKIMVEQYQMIKICLGREFFGSHESARMRAAHGLVFIRMMELNEFYQHSEALQRSMENK